MNPSDLAKVLTGAHITINVQTGTGATQYNGPTQINHHAPGTVDQPQYRCAACGHTSTNVRDFNRSFNGGLTCWPCHTPRRNARQLAAPIAQLIAAAPPDEAVRFEAFDELTRVALNAE